VGLGILPLHSKIIDNADSDDEVEACVRNLWLISFNAEVATAISKQTTLMNGNL
jgi:hypothetical protein